MQHCLQVFLFFLQLWMLKGTEANTSPPHIIFIYADDLGWNDVSFHGSPEIPTPNLDALAANGILLNRYYGEFQCAPSRGALLTGRYPSHLGLQHFAIQTGEPSVLPLNETLMPTYLKKFGYESHMMGKWHLGHMRKDYYPTKRGFDSFLGFVNSHMDYYDHTHLGFSRIAAKPFFHGLDLYDGLNPMKCLFGKYSTDLFTERALNIINNHESSKPLFLYMAHNAPHTANSYMLYQAPPEAIQKLSHIKDMKRRTFAAQASVMDDSVGAVFQALYRKDMLKNSIIIFASDNGADTYAHGKRVGSNYPLRGTKLTLWEGAVRIPAFVWSPLLNLKEPRISTEFFHVTDWLPTLYSAAGGDASDLRVVDGKNLWPFLKYNSPSPRTELLINIDSLANASALLDGHFKVVSGHIVKKFDGWYGPTGLEHIDPPKSMTDWIFKNGSVVKDILHETGMWINKDMDDFYKRSQIHCEDSFKKYKTNCDPDVAPCLFNITADPCEYQDISKSYPEVVKSMLEKIQDHRETAIPPFNRDTDPLSDPLCHDYTFVPWLDPEFYNEKCNFLNHSHAADPLSIL